MSLFRQEMPAVKEIESLVERKITSNRLELTVGKGWLSLFTGELNIDHRIWIFYVKCLIIHVTSNPLTKKSIVQEVNLKLKYENREGKFSRCWLFTLNLSWFFDGTIIWTFQINRHAYFVSLSLYLEIMFFVLSLDSCDGLGMLALSWCWLLLGHVDRNMQLNLNFILNTLDAEEELWSKAFGPRVIDLTSFHV